MNRLNRLVLDPLTLTRLVEGTADLQKSQMDLKLILNNIMEMFSLQAKQKQIHLIERIEEVLV